jgi:hypothetical protein
VKLSSKDGCKKSQFMQFIKAYWVIGCSRWGAHWGSISARKLSSKLCVNSSFYSGINWGKFGLSKQINAETRIKSITTAEAVTAADTVH